MNLSIVIPVYNCEKYLKENIESLLQQGYRDFEAIYVDDGSTDNSLNILKEYEAMDERIRVISQSNGGPSAARNVGIRAARGEYLAFVDADDLLESDFFEQMFNAVQKAKQWANSCATYGALEAEKTAEIMPVCFTTMESHVGIGTGFFSINEWDVLFEKWLLNPPWNKLYSLSIVRDYGIEFPEDLKCGEDLCFNLKYLLTGCVKGFALTDMAIYRYRTDNSESLSSKYDEKEYEMIKCVYEMAEELSVKYNIKDAGVIRNIKCLKHEAIMNCLENTMSKGNKAPYREKFKRNSYIIKDSGVSELIKELYYDKPYWRTLQPVFATGNYKLVYIAKGLLDLRTMYRK